MIERLREKLLSERKSRENLLADGTCTDITQYKVLCAEIKLIDNVIGLMKDFYIEDEIDQ